MTKSQFLISILTIIGSGVVSAIVTYKLNRSKEVKELYRAKLEELFKAVHRYSTILFTDNLLWLDVMKNKITYNEVLELQVKQTNSEDRGHYETCLMLINIYFPELIKDFDNLLKSRNHLNKLQKDFMSEYEKNGFSIKYKEQFNNELLLMGQKEDKIKEMIYRLATAKKLI